MISALNWWNMEKEQLKHSVPKIKTRGHTSIPTKKNSTLTLAKIWKLTEPNELLWTFTRSSSKPGYEWTTSEETSYECLGLK